MAGPTEIERDRIVTKPIWIARLSGRRMIVHVFCGIAAGAAFQADSLHAQQDQPAEAKQFLSEYPAAARRLEEFYTSLQMTELHKKTTADIAIRPHSLFAWPAMPQPQP